LLGALWFAAPSITVAVTMPFATGGGSGRTFRVGPVGRGGGRGPDRLGKRAALGRLDRDLRGHAPQIRRADGGGGRSGRPPERGGRLRGVIRRGAAAHLIRPRLGANDRHAFEGAVIRFLTGFCHIFSAIVAIPFRAIPMTSFKSRAEQVADIPDFGIGLTYG
jgi:multiple sugar transport system permease protein